MAATKGQEAQPAADQTAPCVKWSSSSTTTVNSLISPFRDTWSHAWSPQERRGVYLLSQRQLDVFHKTPQGDLKALCGDPADLKTSSVLCLLLGCGCWRWTHQEQSHACGAELLFIYQIVLLQVTFCCKRTRKQVHVHRFFSGIDFCRLYNIMLTF